MYKFICSDCGLSFEDDNPIKKEYNHPVFGKCWKYSALCPKCQIECSEINEKKPIKKGNPHKIRTGFSNYNSGFRCGCN